MVKEAGLSTRLFYDDHELRSGLVRFLAPDTTPEAFATAAATELGDLRDGDVRRRPPRPRTGLAVAQRHGSPASRSRSSKTIRPARRPAGTRSSSSTSSCTTAATRRSTRGWASSCRSTCSAAAATRRPGTTSAAPDRPTTGAGRPRASTRSATATTGSGVAVRATADAAGGRVVEPDRDRLELGVRVRARLPGQQPAALVAAAARPGRGPPVLGAPGGERRARPRGRGGAGARVSDVPGDRP